MKRLSIYLILFCIGFANNSDAQQLKQANIHTKRCTDKVKLGNLDSSIATAQQILAKPELIPDNPDCKVIGFEISCSQKGKDIWGPIVAHNQYLPDDMKRFLKNGLQQGDRIFIENIRLFCHGIDTCMAIPLFIRGKKS